MTSNQSCDVAGTRSRLACAATRGCWCNSKVIHCTKKCWETNTTTGRYEHARQFFSVAMPFYPSCLVPPAVTLRLCPSVSPSSAVYPSPSLFGSLLPSFTLRLRSPNSLFPLLVFVFASKSRASRSYCSSCFLPTLFNRPLALLRRRYSLSSSFSPHTCTRAGRVRGRRLACARLRTRESHARACYLTCDLYCKYYNQPCTQKRKLSKRKPSIFIQKLQDSTIINRSSDNV